MTPVQVVQAGLVLGALAAGVVVLAIAAGLLWAALVHRRRRDDEVAREAALVDAPLPAGADLPHVVIQIPVFNEGRVVERAVAQALAQDWPRDRVHVQVLDDSTDGTTAVARRAAAGAREAGRDVTLLHRGERTEYKAGALQAGLEAVPHGYFAVFDVDHVYPVDFVRRCMTVLMQRPRVAFVQGALGLLNRDQNGLTRAQGVLLDIEHGLMQPYLAWTGQPVEFNGTGGVWRRQAIEEAGGWRGRTVVEDLELTRRVQERGWRGTVLTSIVSEGEAPARLGDWRRQVGRWMAGHGEVMVARRRPSLLVGALMTYAGAALLSALALVAAPGWGWLLVPSTVGVSAIALASGIVAARTGATLRSPPPRPLRHVLDCATAGLLCLYMGWRGLRALPATLLGRSRPFDRTPKRLVGSAEEVRMKAESPPQ